ncbi:hypothetical protein BKH46_01300 [Helicobacter sp. 12S02634-8]|uniref:aspartate/tyrosine/aromatic aminotransferase n=1 Tax=Helicobacter sp. 12S02634-8 TaxID=1476199 RepID=UPI000BA4EC20|nr:aspartate/tyrosine/aromatic aminotransferase [Helicobacter sp. 12S02634-8]PAF48566.1 hypothetical protein BKH46_01300 [Helicobacter sp. 12S02634-8]
MPQNISIAYLDSQGYDEKNGLYNHFLYAPHLEYFDIYKRLEKGDLNAFDAAIIPTSIDEIHLCKHQSIIKDFLSKRKVIVSFAQNFLPWLVGNQFYIPSEVPIKDREVLICKHKIFEGVREYDLNYRRGVKGFFNRGYFNPPPQAQIILKDNQDRCVAYIDRTSSNGVILSTAGADLLGFGIFDTNTSRKMGVALILWIQEEVQKLKEDYGA